MVAKDDSKSRVIVTLLSVAVALLLGLPVWWNTTKVYRATLPYAEIGQLASLKLHVTINVSLVFVDEKINANFVKSLREKLTSTFINDEHCHVQFIYAITTQQLNNPDINLFSSKDVNAVDDQLQRLWDINHKHTYKFILMPQSSQFSAMFTPCFIGKYNHAMLTYDKDFESATAIMSNVLRNIFIPEKHVVESFLQHTEHRDNIESMRDLKSSTGFHLSFSLINDEPEYGILTWNIKDVVTGMLQPFLDKVSYFDISLDSQVLRYSGVSLNTKADGDFHYITTDDLPHMINPIEAKLGSFVSLNPTLNFIVFVPRQEQTPVKIKKNDGTYSTTNGFLSPRWGGVLIHNVYNRTLSETSSPPEVPLDVGPIMNIFLSQIRLLIGIQPLSSEDNVNITSVLDSGVRHWEIDNLLLRKTVEYLSSSIKTLTSLVALIDKVKNMVIADHIRDEVVEAVFAIKQTQLHLSNGDISGAFSSAKKAIHSSEKAFFDPSVLELLYFPDDQKFAIYIPLFLPISLPLLVSLFTTIKWLKNQRRLKNGHEKQS